MLSHSFTTSLAIVTLVFSFILLITASAHKQEFRVTEVVLKPDDPKPSGPCPVTVHSAGYITTNGRGTVKYTFTRSDGVTAPVFTLEFKVAGTQSVSTDWTLGDAATLPAYQGWQAIKILSPNEMESSHNSGAFALSCGKAADASQHESSGDLLSVLASSDSFTLLLKGLKQTGQEGLLQGKSQYTLFAPTDRALETLSKQRLDMLLSSQRDFKDFVLRHLVAGIVTTKEMGSGKIRVLTSIAGSALSVRVDQGAKASRVILDEDSAIVRPDLMGANGVVQGVDTPLKSSLRPVEVMPRSVFNPRYQDREARAAEFQHRYYDPQGRTRPDLLEFGISAARGLSASRRAATNNGKEHGPNERTALVNLAHPPQVNGIWSQIGPQPLVDQFNRRKDSGEVTGIAIDPRGIDDKVIYIATHAGGIWKTTDGGYDWTPKTDDMPSLSIGAIALDPTDPNIVYAGTGSGFDGVAVFLVKGIGIYRSINCGDSWQIKGRNVFGALPPTSPGSSPRSGAAIYQIALPSSSVLIVATNQGLYRSIDGGENFGANSPTFNDGQPLVNGVFVGAKVDTPTRGWSMPS
jgi:uncharacterized surface protein with fasciclin (FAS1) repeats